MIFAPELIKGTFKTIVLKLLADNKKMYGYEITQKVKELTLGKIQITEGTLYPTLLALESEGLVTTEKIKEFAEFVSTMQTVLDINLKTI